MTEFLILSAISSIVEFGVSLMLYVNGSPLWVAVLGAAAYQLGNILPSVKNRKVMFVISIVSLLLAIVAAFTSGIVMTVSAIVFCMIASVVIQGVRSANKANCSTQKKRLFRIIGLAFAFTAVLAPVVLSVISGYLVFVTAKQLNSDKPLSMKKYTRGRKLHVTMIFHQVHYFVYTYVMPPIVCTYLIRMGLSVSLSVLITSLVLAVNWVVYALPGYLLSRYDEVNHKTVFFCCHMALALFMVELSIGIKSANFTLILTAWILTGFGGGCVFCIKKITPNVENYDINLSEDIGHILGTVLCVLFTAFAGSYGALISTSVSVVCVLITIAGGVILAKK